jgi:hypothetical protein
VDDPIREFDLVQVVDNFIRLAQRLASLKKVTLEPHHHESDMTVHNNPFLLQQILFLCIKHSLNISKPGDIIKVGTKKEDTKVQIEVARRRDQAAILDWDQVYISQLVNFIGGNLEIIAEGETETILFAFDLRVV